MNISHWLHKRALNDKVSVDDLIKWARSELVKSGFARRLKLTSDELDVYLMGSLVKPLNKRIEQEALNKLRAKYAQAKYAADKGMHKVTLNISSEINARLNQLVDQGHFRSKQAIVETAVRRFLASEIGLNDV